MTQRYHHPDALDNMAHDRCPECGEFPEMHLDDVSFWLPRKCDLLPGGVRDRIAQFNADEAAS